MGYPPQLKSGFFEQTSSKCSKDKFNSHEQDRSGLQYFNARYYDPELGRFAQADPTIPDPLNSQAFNRYMFCYGNPISFADVSGFTPNSSGQSGTTETVTSNGESLFTPDGTEAGAPAITPTVNAPEAPSVTPSKSPSEGTPQESVSGTPAAPSMYGPGHSDSASQQINVSPYNFDFGRDYNALAGQLWDDKHYATSMYFYTVADAEAFDDIYACYVGAQVVGIAVEIAAATPEAIAYISSMLSTRGVSQAEVGYKSFAAFKRAFGSAGSGRQWHHFVEQNPSNIAKFGQYAIQNTKNIVAINTNLHYKISGLYSSIRPDITGSTSVTVRQWLSNQSFDAQMQFGKNIYSNVILGK